VTAAPIEVLLSGPVIAELSSTARAALPNETGGLLLGWWETNDEVDAVIVRHAIEVPDRRATPVTWVRRPSTARTALSRALTALKHPLLGYVGDWHSHPESCPASRQDQASLLRTSLQYEHPVLLLIHLPGGVIDIAAGYAGQPRSAVRRQDEGAA